MIYSSAPTEFVAQVNRAGSAGRSDDHASLLSAGFRFALVRASAIQNICNGLYVQTCDLCCCWIGPVVASC